MACPLPHTFDEIQALVTKLIDEDIIRQKALMELAVQFENASTTKIDFRKAYEKCYDITHKSRALVLRQTLEEEARAEKEWEEKMKKEQAEYELFMLEFGMQSDSKYETD
ncbi:hypothetical protein Tco_0285144 [Tanacetum coccineum]